MKSILLLFQLLFMLPAFSAEGLHLQFSEPKVRQGEVVEIKLQLKEETAQRVELQKLKNQTLADTVYVYDVGPLIKKDSGALFEADAKVILVKPLTGNVLLHKAGVQDLVFTWSPVEVQAIEAAPQLIFGSFEIPERKKILLWLGILLGAWALLFLGIRLKKQFSVRKLLKEERQKLRAELTSARDYPQIVEVWKKKTLYFREFPECEEAFKDFETVLFKHQFKPRQSEIEKNEVKTAYLRFVEQFKGGASGV